MKQFRFEGLSDSGTAISGTVEAPDKSAAVAKAREQCRVLTKIELVYTGSLMELLNTDMGALLSGGKIPHKKLAILCSQLSIQLKAGMPLVRSLELAARNSPDRQLQRILQDVTEDVRSGDSLADAFQSRGPNLPAAFIALIRAGEASGTLDDSFARLQTYYEDSAEVSSKVGSAMIYPALLLGVAAIVITVIMVYAVPVFQRSFASLGSELPLPTRILMVVSTFLSQHLALIVAVFSLAAMGLLLLSKSQWGSRMFAQLALDFPGLGQVNRMTAAARFSSTLAAMLGAGLSLVDAAGIAAETAENALIVEAIRAACQGVVEGNPLSQGLKKSELLPDLLTEMTAVGEETGQLEETLRVVSSYYTGEVATAVKRALEILEPAITLVLAGLVVFILLSVYLPIFGMYGAL